MEIYKKTQARVHLVEFGLQDKKRRDNILLLKY